ncbi:MAG: response regulator transcription factor [Myxococcota bacterium]|jgi:DNA-binding response OmpR family regulator|nr:response regulator transcription factor [Myxococcota bacterium]
MSESIARILLVEDDETIALGVMTALEHAGYHVEHVDNGTDALTHLTLRPTDLVILDIMLPGINGLEVLRGIRADRPRLPVILATARSDELDRVLGLELGADDYVTKPFSIRELLARVRARLRVVEPPPATRLLRFSDVIFDLPRRIVQRNDEEIRLSPHEAGILAFLIDHPREDITRDRLLSEVWDTPPASGTRTVDNQVVRLRKKIEKTPSRPRHILTVHGVGYRFEP